MFSCSHLGHTAGELGHFDLLLGEVSLETGEDDLPLTRLQAVNQTEETIIYVLTG
jgi:hypothetical protein